MRSLFMAFTLAAVIASPAMAQEVDMGGFKVGGLIGSDSLKIGGEKKTGFLYGATAGYDADLGRVIIGAEVEFSGSSSKKTVSSSSPPLIAIPQASEPLELVSYKPRGDFHIGARIGFEAFGNSIIYLKAAYARSKIRMDFTDEMMGITSINRSHKGFRIGPGIEVGLTPVFAIRAEYRYTKYKNLKYLDADTGIKIKRNQFVLGLLGRF